MSDKIVFLRSISRSVLLVFLLLSMVWISFTKSIGHASSMNTPKASADNLNSLYSDVNGDGVVDILDLTVVAIAWNSRPQDPKWNPKLDLNADGVVNIFDMVLLVKDFGRSIERSNERVFKHLVVYPHTFTDEEASFVASHFDLVGFDFHATVGWQKIKQSNPNVVMVGYADIMFVDTYYEGWAEVNAHEDWFLHDIRGGRLMSKDLASYVMDVGNIGWRDHFSKYCKAHLAANPLADGILADDVWDESAANWDPFSVPVSEIPSSVGTNWNTNVGGMIQYVKNALGTKLLAINSPERNGAFIQYCDGQSVEHFLHRGDRSLTDFAQTDPIDEMNLLEKLSATGKIVLAQSAAAIPQNPTPTDIELVHKCVVYCLSGFLLGYSGKASYGFQSLHVDYTGHMGYWDEMDAPVGTPVGAKYNVQGDLWARDFTAGKVYLNIGNLNTYTVNVAGTKYTITPRSGLIVPT